MDELKKCPFCGGKAAVFVHNGSNAVQQVVDAWNRRADHG